MAGSEESLPDRFVLVSSIFVIWTLNPTSRQRDAITNDLLAVLAAPAVTAGYLLYLLFYFY
jgi:hypothetical protein